MNPGQNLPCKKMTNLCIFCFKKQPLPVKVKNVKNKVTFDWKLTICDLFKLSIDLDDYLLGDKNSYNLMCSECTGDLKKIDGINWELKILNETLQEVKVRFEDRIVQSQSQGVQDQDGGGGVTFDEHFDSGVFEIRNMIFESIQQERPADLKPSVDVEVNADMDMIEIEDNLDDIINISSPFHVDNDDDFNIQSDQDQDQNDQTQESQMNEMQLKHLSVQLEQIPLEKFNNLNGIYNVNEEEIVKFVTNEKIHLTSSRSMISIVKIKKTNSGPRSRKYRKIKSLIPESIRRLRLSKAKEIKCTQCSEKFSGKKPYQNLRQHYLWKHTDYTKNEEFRFPCTICNRSFIKVDRLENHMKMTHTLRINANGSPVKSYSCSICKKSYASMGTLSRHKREHGLVGKHQNFKCKVKNCGSRFASKYKLKMHMSKHSNTRPHLCQFCPASYKTEISLKNHMQLEHTEGQSFPCTFENCSRKFLTSKLLDEHVKGIHENQVRFMCTKCGKGFYNQKKLKSHILYHPGNLRYECVFCSKAYSKPDRLAEHVYSHNKERGLPEISCPYCPITFKGMISKKRHLKLYHSSVPSASANAMKVINDVVKKSRLKSIDK